MNEYISREPIVLFACLRSLYLKEYRYKVLHNLNNFLSRMMSFLGCRCYHLNGNFLFSKLPSNHSRAYPKLQIQAISSLTLMAFDGLGGFLRKFRLTVWTQVPPARLRKECTCLSGLKAAWL